MTRSGQERRAPLKTLLVLYPFITIITRVDIRGKSYPFFPILSLLDKRIDYWLDNDTLGLDKDRFSGRIMVKIGGRRRDLARDCTCCLDGRAVRRIQPYVGPSDLYSSRF